MIFRNRAKCCKIFLLENIFKKMIFLKLFYDRNHFTSKEMGPFNLYKLKHDNIFVPVGVV
jgi:hypothetical protein